MSVVCRWQSAAATMGSECSPEKRPDPVVPAADAKAPAKDGKSADAPAASAAPAPTAAPAAAAASGGGGGGGSDDAGAIAAAEKQLAEMRQGIENSFPNKHMTVEFWKKLTAEFDKSFGEFKAKFGASANAEAVKALAACEAVAAKSAAHLALLQQKLEFDAAQSRLAGEDITERMTDATDAAKALLKKPDADTKDIEAKAEALNKAFNEWLAVRPDTKKYAGLSALADTYKSSMSWFDEIEADAKTAIEQLKAKLPKA